MLSAQIQAAVAACTALLTALPGQVHLPGSAEYTASSSAVWSQTCVLAPACVLEPESAAALGTAVQLLQRHSTPFAVRGGGHMPIPGAQSADGSGVMISMARFATRELSEDGSVAHIGPGQTWAEVYGWLGARGLAVNGGRYPSVGVGGVLLGGGIGYFAGHRGWSVDDVLGWQVVLANGSIVEVDGRPGHEHADLAWALRGGHNHFGLVTRFSMRTFAMGAAYGGLLSFGATAQPGFFGALAAYMAPGGGGEDPASAINGVATLQVVDGAWRYSLTNVVLYAAGESSPRALENFTAIDSQHVLGHTARLHDNWASIPSSLTWVQSRQYRQSFYEITFRADDRAVTIANQTWFAGASNELRHVDGLTMVLSLQPITRVWLEASKRKGGNLLGLDPDRDAGCYAAMLICTWDNAHDDEAVDGFTRKAAREIQAKTEALGLYHPFVYLNDAGKGQKPFESYAGGANLPRLRAIQAKYDPEGFLRRYLQHGFGLEAEEPRHTEL